MPTTKDGELDCLRAELHSLRLQSSIEIRKDPPKGLAIRQKLEEKHGVRVLYVLCDKKLDRRGFREKLHHSGVEREGILNISSVREGMMEVLVQGDRYDGFMSSMREHGFEVDSNLDPMDQKDPVWLAQPGEDIMVRIRQNFVDRLSRDIKTVREGHARDFLGEWMNVAN
jgi:hypothetical protein